MPRRSAKVAHFCSFKVAHTENTIWRRANRMGSDIIHAKGVQRIDFSSAASGAQ
jgi:hypothetical protein